MLSVKPLLCSIVLLPSSAILTNLTLFIFHVPNTTVLLFTVVKPFCDLSLPLSVQPHLGCYVPGGTHTQWQYSIMVCIILLFFSCLIFAINNFSNIKVHRQTCSHSHNFSNTSQKYQYIITLPQQCRRVTIYHTWTGRPQPAWDSRRGEEFFERGPNFLNYLCPVLLNYVQNIFPGGAKIVLGGAPLVTAQPINNATLQSMHKSTHKMLSCNVKACFHLS